MNRHRAFRLMATAAILAGIVISTTGCPRGQNLRRIFIANGTHYYITDIYLQREANQTWGNNWLTSPVAPEGDFFDFIVTGSTDDTYQLRIIVDAPDAQGNEETILDLTGFDVPDGQTRAVYLLEPGYTGSPEDPNYNPDQVYIEHELANTIAFYALWNLEP